MIRISTNENVNQKMFFVYNLSQRIFPIIEMKFKQKTIPHKGIENNPIRLRMEKNILTTP